MEIWHYSRLSLGMTFGFEAERFIYDFYLTKTAHGYY